jgi:PAS domain S-box-containing protein
MLSITLFLMFADAFGITPRVVMRLNIVSPKLRFWLAILLAVVVGGAGFAYWMHDSRDVYWMGFVDAPPILVRQADGRPAGFVYEVIAEAARREGIRLEWIECGQDGVAALRSGRVDLWPLTVDLPERRTYVYFSDPWLQTEPMLMVRKGEKIPGPEFQGVFACKDTPVFTHLLRECFPKAASRMVRDYRDGVLALMDHQVDAVLYTTWDADYLDQVHQELDTSGAVKIAPMPGRLLNHCVASTFRQKAVADRLRRGLDQLARDGTLASVLRRHSWQGAAMIQPTFEQLEVRQRARRLAWLSGALSVAFMGLTVLVWFLYRTRKRAVLAEAASAVMVERYALAAQATNDAIWDWQPALGIIEWGDGLRTRFGYGAEHLRSDLNWRQDHIHPEDRDRVMRSIHSVFEGGESSWSADYRFIRENGTYAYVMDYGQVIYGADGKPVRMVGAIADQTQRRELEIQLHQAQKMEAIGRLAGGVAHDFNNLLTVLRGYSDLMLHELPEGSRSQGHARQISKVTDRGGELVKQLLAFSRRQIIQPRPMNMNTLLLEDEEMIRSLLGEDVELVLSLSPSLPLVLADPNQWNQVIVNLAVNARDAMPGGGRIVIETTTAQIDPGFVALHPGANQGLHVLMSVSDSGTGIDSEVLLHIFEPFFTTKEAGRGTGLGLSTVYGIVNQSRGYIDVASKLGQGTSFKIYLPVHIGTLPELEGPAPDLHRVVRSARVLVVEDQDEVRALTAEILRSKGFRVLMANGSDEALQVARDMREPIDLLLTDVIMPGLNGRVLAEQIRALRPEVRVLYMSGYAEDVITHRGVLEPGLAFLPKPFSAHLLLEKIQQVLES